MLPWKKKKTTTKKVEQSQPLAATKNIEKNLSELVIQSVHEGIVILAPNGNIRLSNPAAEAMIGRSAEELSGMYFDSVINLLDKTGNRISETRNPIKIAINTGDFSETRDLDLVAGDSNKVTPVSIIITPLKDANPGLIVTFRDIAKELEEEHERSDFISTASHEMRTPVASIEGYLGLAMNPQTATVDSRALSYLTKAHEASIHLGKLFQDLLDTSKLDDGRITPRFEPVEIVNLVKQYGDEMIPNITKKGLEEKIELTRRLAKGEGLVYHEKAAAARNKLL